MRKDESPRPESFHRVPRKWHRGQYFGFLPQATQMSIHPSSASEVSEGQKQKAGREVFPAFLKEDLALQE